VTDKQQPQLPSPDVLRDLVKVGVEQIRVRQQELDLQEKENQRQYDYAKEALGVQAGDRRDARQHRRKRDLDRYWFIGGLFLLGVLLIVVLSFMGKDDLAKELAKLAAFYLAGGLSGYGLGKARGPRQTPPDDDGQDAAS
jgi:VIT1/CCC1 family predicted Fe2+/Mn2+ transporter